MKYFSIAFKREKKKNSLPVWDYAIDMDFQTFKNEVLYLIQFQNSRYLDINSLI